jgi:photosystem II stability/assembly factor-like uncharacterized protein
MFALATTRGLLPVGAETLADLAAKTHIHGIAFNRASGNAALIIATHHGIFSLDAKGTPRLLSVQQDFMGFTGDPADPLRYLGSGHPAAGGNSGVIESRDGGATWTSLAEGVNGPVDFHALTASAANPKYLYGAFRGIQMSSDGGKNWSVSGQLPDKLIGLAASAKDPAVLYAATANGLQVSRDSGASWEVAAFEKQLVSLVLVTSESAIFAFVVGRGLMRASEDVLQKWSPLASAFGKLIPLHLAVAPDDSNHMALAAQTNEVFESRDGGRTWHSFGQ